MELAGVTDISLRSTSGSLATRTMHRLGFGLSGKGQEWAEEPPGFEDLMRSRLTRHFLTWYSTDRMCSCMLSLWTLKYGCRGIFTTIFIFLAFGDIIKSYTKTSQVAKCWNGDAEMAGGSAGKLRKNSYYRSYKKQLMIWLFSSQK